MEKYGPYRLQVLDSVTVPYKVREKLNVSKGDFVFWVIDNENRCILKKATFKLES